MEIRRVPVLDQEAGRQRGAHLASWQFSEPIVSRDRCRGRSSPGRLHVDAELTVDDPGGHSNFEKLLSRSTTSVASRIKAAAIAKPARLYMFDMLTIGDRDLRGMTLIKRKAFLRDSFDDTGTLVFMNGIVGAGEWVFEQVEHHGFEGMVAKRLNSPYPSGRTHEWQKVKTLGYGRPAALGFRPKRPISKISASSRDNPNSGATPSLKFCQNT